MLLTGSSFPQRVGDSLSSFSPFRKRLTIQEALRHPWIRVSHKGAGRFYPGREEDIQVLLKWDRTLYGPPYLGRGSPPLQFHTLIFIL